VPAGYDFLNDTEYTQVICPEGAVNCTSGWEGGDFEDFVAKDDRDDGWNPPPPPPDETSPRPLTDKRNKRATSSEIQKIGARPVPQHTYGAGVGMGLDVMLFANVDKYFMTSSFFEGFKVMVHHPEDFPEVKEKGMVLGPGQEMFGGISAIGKPNAAALKEDHISCYFSL
jgi:hypothetical protein